MFTGTRFIADKFGCSGYVRSLVASYGFPAPTEAAVKKWMVRDSIPGEWLPVLLGVLELEHGGPVSVLPYVRAA